MTVLERIDELRKQRGWSINNLALESMLTQSTLNNLYMRNAEPKIATLRAICDAFGITLSEFFKGIDEEKKSDLDSQIQNKIALLSNDQKAALLVLLNTMN